MKATIFAIIAFLYSFSMMAAELEKKVIFLGNPGSGKSALLNAMANKYVAESGLCVGKGLTTKMQIVKIDGFTLIDTPGFADIASEDEVALEIEKSLRQVAYYRLIFVLNLRYGRVMMEDCDTINRILDAINVPSKKFSIIFNRVLEEEREEIFEVPQHYQVFLHIFAQVGLKPSAIKIIDFDPTLSRRKGQFLKLDSALRSFILSDADGFSIICCCKVKKISTESSRRDEIERRRREIEAKALKRRHEELEYRRLQERVRQAESGGGCLIL